MQGKFNPCIAFLLHKKAFIPWTIPFCLTSKKKERFLGELSGLSVFGGYN